jgi:hypothetical protein
MDRYDSRSSNNADEELFYYSAPCRPEDVIFAGSDADETQEEITKNRLRYEYHARRYKRGYLPLLRSASLRGPLTRESGWINPWRYRPRENSDWWQPGSEELHYARENVMKRVADHGLRHLKPAEALAWNKGSAQAEAEDVQCGKDGADIVETIWADEEMEGRQTGERGAPGIQPSTKSRDHRTLSDPLHPNIKTGPSISKSHHSDNGHVDEFEDNITRSAKRPADTQWLRGSYISKRARWDGSAVSSPTPMADIQGERDRRRRHGSSKSIASGRRQLHSVAHPTAPTPDMAQETSTMSPTDRNIHNRAYIKKASNRKNTRISSNDFPRSISNISNHQHQLGNFDELHDDSLVLVSQAKLQRSKAKSQRKALNSADHSLSDLEPDELMAISPPDRQSETPATNDRKFGTQSESGSSKSLTVPRGTQNSARCESVLVTIEQDSFITEIAPSSTDLEKFQYRKKRKTLQSNVCGHESPESNQVHQGSDSEVTALYAQNIVDNEGSISTPAPIVETLVATTVYSTGDAPSIRRSVSPSGKRSNASWDMMDNLAQDFFFNRTSNGTPGVAMAVEDTTAPAPDQVPTSPKSDDDISWSNSRDSHLPQESTTVNHLHAIPSSPTASQQPPEFGENLIHVNKNPDPNDVSTQSYNSTASQSPESPERRLKSPSETHYSARKAETIFVEHGLESTDKAVQTEMEDIQTLLSQNCQSVTSEDSTESDQNHPSQICLGTGHTELRGKRPVGSESETKRISKPGSRSPLVDESVPTQNTESLVQSPAELGKDGEHTPGAGSEASWQGCGPQSPWISTNLDVLPKGDSSKYHGEELFSLPDAEQEIPAPEIESLGGDGLNVDLAFHYLKRSATQDIDGIKPFKEPRTPAPSPRRDELHVANDDLPSTQFLVDAATNNPWTSNFKNPASAKPAKRVSFDVLPAKEQEDSQPESSGHSKESPGSPPPPQTVDRFLDEDTFDDETTEVNKFGKHFIAANAFKHFLPGKIASPIKSSPPIGAMAEAFIEADRDISSEQERRAPSYNCLSRHLKPMSEAKANIAFQDSRSDGFSLVDSFSISPNGKIKATSTKMPDFDMEDSFDALLGDVGGFLEDWSVDAELKKARESASTKDSQSNGIKRRRLFGLI